MHVQCKCTGIDDSHQVNQNKKKAKPFNANQKAGDEVQPEK
jgi:hypothetical protein